MLKEIKSSVLSSDIKKRLDKSIEYLGNNMKSLTLIKNGPLDYIPVKITRKKTPKINDSFPGPGSYAGNSQKHNSPRAVIGNAKRLHILNKSLSPGPGSYETSYKRLKPPN